MVFPKVLRKGKKFLLKFVDGLIEAKFFIFIKIHCVGMNTDKIKK